MKRVHQIFPTVNSSDSKYVNVTYQLKIRVKLSDIIDAYLSDKIDAYLSDKIDAYLSDKIDAYFCL